MSIYPRTADLAISFSAVSRTFVLDPFLEDILLAPWREDYYAAKRLSAADTLLVIEISDSTVALRPQSKDAALREIRRS